VYCDVVDPMKLWKKHWCAMQDDIPSKVSDAIGIPDYQVDTPQLQDYILYELETILTRFGKSVKDFGLPLPPRDMLEDLKNKLLMEERNYRCDMLSQDVVELVPKLNHDQKEVFTHITTAFEEGRQELLFVYGHGGTRKTFLWKTIISLERSQGKIVLAVASSGIASLLLPAGRTAHSRFNLPLDLTDESVCHAKKHSQLGDLLIAMDLIIWDEAPMNDMRCFEALDRTLRDLMRAAKKELIYASIANSYLWPHFKVYMLRENMRLLRSDLCDEQQKRFEVFAKWLLEDGNGEICDNDQQDDEDTSQITVLQEYCIDTGKEGLSKLINFIYDDATLKAPTASTLQEKAIVCPKNDTIDEVNAKILSLTKGVMKTYLITTKGGNTDYDASKCQSIGRSSVRMSETTIAALKVGQKNSIPEAKVYRKWVSKTIPDMKPIGFCCILIDRENNAVQANMDLNNIDYFNPLLKPNTAYRISNFFSYNQLQSRLPYPDENNKIIYPILTDVQLATTPATFYYINPRTPEAADAYKMFKEKYNTNLPLQVCRQRFHDPELEKTRNRQTLQTLLEQDPTSFQGVRFTCEAMVTNVNPNRSWSYSSCSQCSKASTKRNGIYVCENHGNQDPLTYSDKLPTASALTLDQPSKKDEVPDTQLATSSSPTIKESGSKNNDMLGTPPTDVIETIAKTIVSTIPHRPFELHATKENSSAAKTPNEPKAPTAKRSLDMDLSSEAKKRKNIRTVMTVWQSIMAENNRHLKLFPAFSANQSYSNLV
nr:DNA helicase [Tanacetum cinerariifolium]